MGSNPTRPVPAPPAIINYILQIKKVGLQDQTIESHSKILRFLSKHIDLADPEAVRLFIANQHVSAGRKENIVDVYSRYSKFAGIAFEPPVYRKEELIPFVPLEKETEDIIKASRSFKHQVYLRLLKEGAMRCGEASQLRFQHFDFERKTVRVNLPEKHSKSREVKLSDKLIAQLKTFFGLNLTFPTPAAARHYLENTRRILAKSENNARFLQVKLHSFRHFRATQLYSQTKDIIHVQSVLGHKWLQNTLKYTHLVEWKEDSFICKVAKSLDQATDLIENGFDYICEMDGIKLFKKRK